MTDAPFQTQTAAPKKSSPVVRIGAYVLAGGFGVTTLGAVLLAQGRTSFEMAADFVHRFGMFTMLAGLFVLLLGHRWPMLKKLWRQIQESKIMQSKESGGAGMTGEPKLPGAATNAPVNAPVLVMGLPFFLALAAIASLLLFATPLPFAVLVVAFINVMLPAMLTVTAVQCRGYVRTFCIAALFPAGFSLYTLVSLMAPLWMMGRGGYGGFGGGAYGGNQDFEWRIAAFVQWGLILVVGAIGVAWHFFLDASRVTSRTRGDRSG